MGARRIVVGYDGSDAARRAVRWAATEARTRDADLEVVHAHDFPYLDRLGAATRQELHDAAAKVADEGVREAVAAEPTVHASAVVEVGSPAAVLVDRSTDGELLVVGHQGAGGGRHRILGSVATRCVQHASCSVAVIR